MSMKLINRMYVYTAIWLIPFVIIGSIFSFFMIEYIAYEETDEFLKYEMERLVEYHDLHNDFPDFTNVAALIEDVAYNEPFYKDTLLLETGDNEMVPFRELWFSIEHNGRDFTIILRHLLPGSDDVIEGTLFIVTGLMLLIAFFIFLTLSIANRRTWAPFYRTLGILTRFKLSGTVPAFEKTNITEFNTLNHTIEGLLQKVTNDYRQNKEFNENASHELQTHLAVIRASTEKLIDNQEKIPHLAEETGRIYSAVIRLTQVQKSLLLLSRISNREFSNDISLNIADVLSENLGLFSEAMELRKIRLATNIEDCIITMDAGLAEVLITNLIKNAVKHNVEDGFVDIQLSGNKLAIANSGKPFKGNPGSLMHRFTKGDEGNIGIGLAIVKEICDLYRFKISYSIDDNLHTISLFFR